MRERYKHCLAKGAASPAFPPLDSPLQTLSPDYNAAVRVFFPQTVTSTRIREMPKWPVYYNSDIYRAPGRTLHRGRCSSRRRHQTSGDTGQLVRQDVTVIVLNQYAAPCEQRWWRKCDVDRPGLRMKSVVLLHLEFIECAAIVLAHCIVLSRYIAITTFSIIAVIAAFCRISPSILNRFKPNLQA